VNRVQAPLADPFEGKAGLDGLSCAPGNASE